jgi:hypothetical protein
MLYREIMAVCSQIHTKHINTLCGQNLELLNVKLAVRAVNTGLSKVKQGSSKPNPTQPNLTSLTVHSTNGTNIFIFT